MNTETTGMWTKETCDGMHRFCKPGAGCAHFPNQPKAIRFMKFYVTDGVVKARISYSSFVMNSTRQNCVTLYAKGYDAEKALQAMIPTLYENHSDFMTDYFEDGKARIVEGHPLYADALARAQGGR